jgi:hypothetical protein
MERPPVHYLAAFRRVYVACGRSAISTLHPISYTQDAAAVTCKRCLAVMVAVPIVRDE